jgi:hypothetical protein
MSGVTSCRTSYSTSQPRDWDPRMSDAPAKIYFEKLFEANPQKEDYYKCIYCDVNRDGLKLGGKEKKGDKGHTNFRNHFLLNHKKFDNELKDEVERMILNIAPPEDSSNSRLTDFYPIQQRRQASDKAKNIYGWLDLTLNCNLSFHHCENEIARKYSKLDILTYPTMMKYFDGLISKVEKKLAER